VCVCACVWLWVGGWVGGWVEEEKVACEKRGVCRREAACERRPRTFAASVSCEVCSCSLYVRQSVCQCVHPCVCVLGNILVILSYQLT
jgi:hypothetical protein